jgi:deoxycytidine triphosphate deaminase
MKSEALFESGWCGQIEVEATVREPVELTLHPRQQPVDLIRR